MVSHCTLAWCRGCEIVIVFISPPDIRSLGSYGITDGAKLFLTHKPHARTPVTTSSAETTDPQALTGSTAGEGRAPRDPVAMEVDREERMVLTVKLLKGGREETVEVCVNKLNQFQFL